MSFNVGLLEVIGYLVPGATMISAWLWLTGKLPLDQYIASTYSRYTRPTRVHLHRSASKKRFPFFSAKVYSRHPPAKVSPQQN